MAKKSLLRWAHLHSPDTVQEPWRTGQDIGSHKWFSYHRRSLLFQENDQNVWDKKETCFEAPRVRRTCTTMESTKKQEVISAIIVVLIILSQCLEAYVNHEAMQFSIEKLPKLLFVILVLIINPGHQPITLQGIDKACCAPPPPSIPTNPNWRIIEQTFSCNHMHILFM